VVVYQDYSLRNRGRHLVQVLHGGHQSWLTSSHGRLLLSSNSVRGMLPRSLAVAACCKVNWPAKHHTCRYAREIDTLLHKVAEEQGDLPVRSQIEVTAPSYSSSIDGWDPNAWLAGQMVERGWIPPSGEAPSRISEPATPTSAHSVASEHVREPVPEPASSREPARPRDPQYRPDLQPFSLDPASIPGTPEHRSLMRFIS
jgi:hypothetical protein